MNMNARDRGRAGNQAGQAGQQSPKVRYEIGIGELDADRELVISVTAWLGKQPLRNADVSIELPQLDETGTYATRPTNQNGNVLFKIDVPNGLSKLTISGSINAGQNSVNIKPLTWQEGVPPTPTKLVVMPLGAVDGVYGFDVRITDDTEQLEFAGKVQVVSHGQVQGYLASAASAKQEGPRFRLTIGKEGDIIYLKPLTKEAKVYLSLPGNISRSEIFTLTQAKDTNPTVTGLKVTPDSTLPNTWHLQVEASDLSLLAAKLQAYSSDGTKITVKADGRKIGNGNKATADFTAEADGRVVVEVEATAEADRNKDHGIFFKVIDAKLAPSGPFVIKKTEKKATPRPTALKVTPDTTLQGVFQLQVEGDQTALAAGIQTFSGDGTKLTVKVNGVLVGDPAQASADFNAGDDGTALVEIATTDEAKRDKDRPVYFKLTGGNFGAKGPFFLPKLTKKITNVETFVVAPRSGLYKGTVPFDGQLKSADSSPVKVVIKASEATTIFKIEVEGLPDVINASGQTEIEVKGDGSAFTANITLTDSSVATTRITFFVNATGGVLNQGPFKLAKLLAAPATT